MPSLAEIERNRQARKDKLAAERNVQRALDLEAIDALEVEHGDANISIIELDYVPGLPTCVAVKVTPPAVLLRYQARLRNEDKTTVDAAKEVCDSCRIYPSDDETWTALLQVRPALYTQMGVEAVNLGRGKTAAEAKK
jgi:hypothetical protein